MFLGIIRNQAGTLAAGDTGDMASLLPSTTYLFHSLFVALLMDFEAFCVCVCVCACVCGDWWFAYLFRIIVFFRMHDDEE